MKKKNLSIDGVDVSYLDSEIGSHAMIFCHGNSSSARAFDVLSVLLDKTVRTIALNFYGHGGVSLGRRCTIKECALLLQRLVSALNLPSFTVVGHSFGGHVAMEAALSLADNGLQGLLAISAPPFGAHTISQAFKKDPTGGLLFKSVLDTKEVEMLSGNLVNRDRISTYQYRVMVEDISSTQPEVRPAIGGCVTAGDYSDEIKILHQLDVPVLFIQGKEDPFINIDYYAKRMNFPDWRENVFFINDCYHCPHIESAYGVANIIKSYVKKNFDVKASDVVYSA